MAALSVLSVDESHWTVALMGPLTGENSDFLDRHLREITGNVVLECEKLEDLDDDAASVLLEFREGMRAQGFWVALRGITPRCRAILLDCARHRAASGTSRIDRAEASAMP